MITVGVREMLEDDRSWVTKSWQTNFQHDSDWAGKIDGKVFERSHRTVMHRLLKDHTTLVAYDPKDSRVLLGFVCGDNYPSAFVVQYAYTRANLRRQGIAKGLMEHMGWTPSKPIMVTHHTPSVKRVARERLVIYNPYFAFLDFAGALHGKTTRGLEETGAEGPVISIGSRRRRAAEGGTQGE